MDLCRGSIVLIECGASSCLQRFEMNYDRFSLKEQNMITPRSQGGKIRRLIELQLAQPESVVYERYRRLYLADYDRRKLKQYTGIENSELIHRLYLAGFRSENVMALNTFPVVMTAWATGTVTIDERRAAEAIVFEPDMIANGPAIEMFRHWLQEKPPTEWWVLWEEFTHARSTVLAPRRVKELKRAVMIACRKVALASGGIWGLGKISPAEQRVLNRTSRFFQRLGAPNQP